MPFLELAEIQEERERLRATSQRLVFTNGHFELLHLGHLRYLEQARALGDALFVAVNGDASTRRLKARRKILVPASERATLIAALRPVTASLVFEEDTASALITLLQPEIYVKGGDYARGKTLPERTAVERYGGRVIIVNHLVGYSTSALLERLA